MTTPMNPTPQGISALLKRSGHVRSISEPSTLTEGYRVTGDHRDENAVRVRQVFWPDSPPPEEYKEKLAAYARTITEAGWAVEAGEWELVVAARKG